MKLRLASCLASFLFAGLVAAPAAAQEAASAGPTRGDTVVIEGRLVDPAGEPIEGAVVMLATAREHFSLRAFGTTREAPLLQPATTGVDGRFAHRWLFDPHYNHHELRVGVEVRRDGRPAFETVTEREITAAVATGGPVGLGDWTIERAGYLRFLVRWVAGDASDAEEKLLRDNGRPDKLTAEPGGVDAWWYFATGKVYRVRDGEIDQVIHFDPVESPPPA